MCSSQWPCCCSCGAAMPAVGAIALALGFTRGVAPALGCAALAHLVMRWREDRAAGARAAARAAADGGGHARGPRCLRRRLAGVVGVVSGLPTAFFDVQAAWGQRPDRGPFVLWLTWAWDEQGPRRRGRARRAVGTYIALVLGRHGRWLAIEAAGLGAGVPALPLRGGAAHHEHVAVPAAGLPDRRAGGLRRDAHLDGSRRRAALAPPGGSGRRRPRGAGSSGSPAALLTFTPWDAAPP